MNSGSRPAPPGFFDDPEDDMNFSSSSSSYVPRYDFVTPFKELVDRNRSPPASTPPPSAKAPPTRPPKRPKKPNRRIPRAYLQDSVNFCVYCATFLPPENLLPSCPYCRRLMHHRCFDRVLSMSDQPRCPNFQCRCKLIVKRLYSSDDSDQDTDKD